MDDSIQLLIAAGSVIASIVATISLFYAKKRIVSDVFPKIRFKRFNIVRNAIGSFMDSYIEEANLKPENRNKLKQALFKAELTFHYSNKSTFTKLKEILYGYLEADNIITDHHDLIIETQKVLNWLMARAKLEMGITPEIDEKNRNILIKQLRKYEGYEFLDKCKTIKLMIVNESS